MVPTGTMVGVAQLVEHLVVVQDVAGSSPVTHPKVGRASDVGESGTTVTERRT
jgi:hypothetical protein